jgi:hypothetical protein
MLTLFEKGQEARNSYEGYDTPIFMRKALFANRASSGFEV